MYSEFVEKVRGDYADWPIAHRSVPGLVCKMRVALDRPTQGV